jgi:hypothetical protein
MQMQMQMQMNWARNNPFKTMKFPFRKAWRARALWEFLPQF